MLIISFSWMNLVRADFNKFAAEYSTFTDNWDDDLVFKIDSTNTAALPDSSFYWTMWNGTWPGTRAGCYCTAANANSRMKVRAGVFDSTCNGNQTKQGCQKIASTPSASISKWLLGQTIYAARKRGTSFLANYRNMNSDGTCKFGFTRCGSGNSVSKGICLPSSLQCPLTDISSTGGPGYTQAGTFTGFSLYTSKSNSQNPVSELYIHQDHLCFLRSQNPLSPGRPAYPLLNGNYSNCATDDNAWSAGSLGEASLFALNGIRTSGLTGYDSNDGYLYKLLAARMFDWSPACAEYVPMLQDHPNQMRVISGHYQTLFIIYIVSFVFGLFSFAGYGAAVMTHSSHPRCHLGVFAVRFFTWFIMVPSMFICATQVSKFVGNFDSITSLSCSNSNNNSNLKKISDSLKATIVKKNVVMIVLSFVGLLIESILVCAFHYTTRKDRYVNSVSPARVNSTPAEVQPGGTNILAKPDLAPEGGYVQLNQNDQNEGKAGGVPMAGPANDPLAPIPGFPPGFLEGTPIKEPAKGNHSAETGKESANRDNHVLPIVQEHGGVLPPNFEDRTLDLPPGFLDASAGLPGPGVANLEHRNRVPNSTAQPLPPGFLDSQVQAPPKNRDFIDDDEVENPKPPVVPNPPLMNNSEARKD